MDHMAAADKITMHLKEGKDKKTCLNLCQEWNISLSFAANYGYWEIANMFLEAGENVNIFNGEPLTLACDKGCLEIIYLLLRNGADVRLDEYGPFRAAINNDNERLVKLLMEYMPAVSPWKAEEHKKSMLYLMRLAASNSLYHLRDYLREQLELQLGEQI